MTSRLFFKCQYRGPSFGGWQVQPNCMSVQACLEQAFKKEFQTKGYFRASGRTDSGVHAVNQMVELQYSGLKLPPKAIRERLNKVLPRAVSLSGGWAVSSKAHIIRSVLWKHYRYFIYQNAVRSPLFDERAWILPQTLSIEVMNEAAQELVGHHDFRAFMAVDGKALTTHRKVFKCQVKSRGKWIQIDVVGEGFLKNMVRNIVGTLVEVGLGRRKPEDIKAILSSKNRRKAGRTAPPQGLYLMEVRYPEWVWQG